MAQLPDALQERIDSSELFFWDAVRDDVLARLLALNAERYAEEVAQGLHGKAGKKPATNPTAGGKRRGRPAKASQGGETVGQQTEQMGLGL